MGRRRYPPTDPREWLNRAKSNLVGAGQATPGVYLEDLCFDAQPNRLTVRPSPSIRRWWLASSWKIRRRALPLHMTRWKAQGYSTPNGLLMHTA